MKNEKRLKLNTIKAQLLTLLLIITTFTNTYYAQQDGYEDKTESPYFLVKGNTENIRLPLKSTNATVTIAGVITDVKVKQVYTNTGNEVINATYVFPGSTKSAVYGMQMKIEERIIIAEIKEKEEAKEIFEQAKNEGKNASLLQQRRPNVFQMDVANIQPGQTIIVELFYNELITPEGGIYEFVYPKVVGPRYADKDGVLKDPWVQNPHNTTQQGSWISPTKSTFNIDVNLTTSLPLQQVQSFSHQVDINYPDGKSAIIQLKSPNVHLDNKDFILNYSLAGGQIETGISLFRGEKENFFLMMMEPPKRVKNDEITPREYIFIIDVSGSMNGFPIDITQKLMKELLEKLTPVDRFNILLFAASSDVLSERSLSVTPENIKKGMNFINKEHGSGSTELLPALKRTLALPKSEGYSRSVVITTDGYVTVEKEAFDLIKENLGDANFFSFGIGTNINRYLIEGLARVGKGEPLVITNEVDAKEKASKFIEYIQSPILTDIKIDFKGLNAYDVEPTSFPDLFAERPLLVYGKWKGKPKGKIEVIGRNKSGQFKNNIEVTKNNISVSNEALKYLWARNRITILSDYNNLSGNKAHKEEITQLGLTYNLLTAYTSFVGVDDGVQSDEAVQQNANSGAVPEPHEWALIITALLFVSFLIYQRYVI